MPNIYLFYGEDDFSLRRKVEKWKHEFAKKYSPQAVVFFDGQGAEEGEVIKQLQGHLSPSLFSAKKLLILRDCLPKKADSKLIDYLLELPAKAPKDYFVVFWQTSRPDRRLKFYKEFLAQIRPEEFNLPHGMELNAWIKAMAQNLKAEISPAAIDLLAKYLGRDLYEEKKAGGRVVERKEAFDLWQVNSELVKLATTDKPIGPELVAQMVKPKIPDSVFALSDALITGRKQDSFAALANYLEGAGVDEKSAFIKMIGLLSDQFRSMLVVNLLQQQGLSSAQIAEKLGWSSGRVFVVSKNAKSFSPQALQGLLGQLLAIDIKLKTTDSDPKLLMDLFLARV